VISDLMMPKISGLELLKEIRIQDKKVFVIMITGYPSVGDAVNAIKEGAYDYLVKPIHLEDIRYQGRAGAFHQKDGKTI
jgi:DNA-binding NtrC family response regulator